MTQTTIERVERLPEVPVSEAHRNWAQFLAQVREGGEVALTRYGEKEIVAISMPHFLATCELLSEEGKAPLAELVRQALDEGADLRRRMRLWYGLKVYALRWGYDDNQTVSFCHPDLRSRSHSSEDHSDPIAPCALGAVISRLPPGIPMDDPLVAFAMSTFGIHAS